MKNPETVRIIAGKWRRRQIRFAPISGLRPTPDAVRETLFNWLMPTITGTHCLDLFAGSGALGLEAVSRGASHVTLVDSSRAVTEKLRAAVTTLDAHDQVSIVMNDANTFLSRNTDTFDIVFLDPPFRDNLLPKAIAALIQKPCFTPTAMVYLEREKSGDPLPIPADWHIIREATRGMVSSTLIQT